MLGSGPHIQLTGAFLFLAVGVTQTFLTWPSGTPATGNSTGIAHNSIELQLPVLSAAEQQLYTMLEVSYHRQGSVPWSRSVSVPSSQARITLRSLFNGVYEFRIRGVGVSNNMQPVFTAYTAAVVYPVRGRGKFAGTGLKHPLAHVMIYVLYIEVVQHVSNIVRGFHHRIKLLYFVTFGHMNFTSFSAFFRFQFLKVRTLRF